MSDNTTRQPFQGMGYLRGSQYFTNSYQEENDYGSTGTPEPRGHPSKFFGVSDSTPEDPTVSTEGCSPPPSPPLATENLSGKREQEELFSWQPPILIGPSLSPRYGTHPGWRMLMFSPFTYTQPMPPAHLRMQSQSGRGRAATTLLLARPRYVLQDYFQYQIAHLRELEICSQEGKDWTGGEVATNGGMNARNSTPPSSLFEPAQNSKRRYLSMLSTNRTIADIKEAAEGYSGVEGSQRSHSTESAQDNQNEVPKIAKQRSLTGDSRKMKADDVLPFKPFVGNTTGDCGYPQAVFSKGPSPDVKARRKHTHARVLPARRGPDDEPLTAAAGAEENGAGGRRLEEEKVREYLTAGKPGYAQETEETEGAACISGGSSETFLRGFSLSYVFTALHERACLSATGLASVAASVRRSREVFEKYTTGKGQNSLDRATFYCQAMHLEASSYEDCMRSLPLEIYDYKHHVPRQSNTAAENRVSMTVAQAILSRIRS